MSETLKRVQALVSQGEFLVSRHGYRELAADDILPDEIVSGLYEAITIEDYRMDPRGPSVLVLQHDATDQPIHVVWAIPVGARGPAILVTAYRPDPDQWSEDFRRRKP